MAALVGCGMRARSSSSVANKGYKRYLKAEKGAFAVDLDKATRRTAIRRHVGIAYQHRAERRRGCFAL